MLNFSFANKCFPDVAKQLERAEKTLFVNPQGCMVTIRAAIESLVKHISILEDLDFEPDSKELLGDLLRRVEQKSGLSPDAYKKMHFIIEKGNEASHKGYNAEEDAKKCLKYAYEVLVKCVRYFFQEKNAQVPPYQEPVCEVAKPIEKSKLERYCTKLIEEYKQQNPPFVIFPNILSLSKPECENEVIGKVLEPQYLFIKGDAGTGKTYLTISLQALCAAVWLSKDDRARIERLLKYEDIRYKCVILRALEGVQLKVWHYAPIIICLSEYRTNESLLCQLAGRIRVKTGREKVSDIALKYHLENGECLVVLDGFDEISRECIDRAASDIKDFISKYPQNRYIVTSRFGFPNQLSDLKEKFSLVPLSPLTDNQTRSLAKRLQVSEDSASWEDVASICSEIQQTPLNINIMLKAHSKAKNETDLYVKYVCQEMQREFDKKRCSEFLSVDTPLKLVCDLAYEIHKRDKLNIIKSKAMEFLREKSGSIKCAEQTIDLLHTCGIGKISEQDDGNSISFAHESIKDALVAISLYEKLTDDFIDIDGTEFYENIVANPKSEQVVWRLLEICQVRNAYERIDRILHYLIDIDLTRAIVPVKDFRLSASDKILVEITNACQSTCSTKNWQHLGAAYYWLGRDCFEQELTGDLPYFWYDVADVIRGNYAFFSNEVHPDAWPFQDIVVDDNKTNSRLGYNDCVRRLRITPENFQLAIALIDKKEWYTKNSQECTKVAPTGIYKLLMGDKEEKLLALEELEGNFSVETYKQIFAALKQVLKTGKDEMILAKMVLYLGRIGYINRDEGLRRLMVTLTRYLRRVLLTQRHRTYLLGASCRALYLMDGWDSELKKKLLIAKLYSGDEDLLMLLDLVYDEKNVIEKKLNKCVGFVPQEMLYDNKFLDASPDAWLLCELQRNILGGFDEIICNVEQLIKDTASSYSWNNSSLEVKHQILKNLFISFADPKWAVFRGVLEPVCKAVCCIIMNWFDWTMGTLGSLADEDQETVTQFLKYQAGKIEDWSNWLEFADLPMKLVLLMGHPAWSVTEEYNGDKYSIFESVIQRLKLSTIDANVLFHICYAAEHQGK